MYNLIYDFIVDNLLQNTQLESLHSQVLGVDLTLQSWLGHTITVGIIIAIVLVLAVFVRWIFRQFAGLLGR